MKNTISGVVTDIEGTTTALDFVHKTLFPYARARIADWARRNENNPALDEARRLAELPDAAPLDALVQTLVQWIDEDRKAPPLKTIQGKIWREGFETGAFESHFYPDVFPCLEKWKQAGATLSVYSSGSAEAQALLFQYTVWGDKRNLISHFFDTAMGAKRETASYTRIRLALALPAERLLFLSDVGAELAAARADGWQVGQLIRPGVTPDPAFAPFADFYAADARFF